VQLTHFGHSCVLIDTGAARLLIDPGTFSSGFESLTGLDAVPVTRQHPDHLAVDRSCTPGTRSRRSPLRSSGCVDHPRAVAPRTAVPIHRACPPDHRCSTGCSRTPLPMARRYGSPDAGGPAAV
jgi:hypothetical protein